MYSVWFEDLESVIQLLRQYLPKELTFKSIKGDALGNFVIETEENTYIVDNMDFSIYKMLGTWDDCTWLKIH